MSLSKITANSTSNLFGNTVFTGTGFMKVPSGNTAQRPVSPLEGYLRYNTTLGYLEQYTPSGWTGIAASPVVNSVSPTVFNGTSGTAFTISGAYFDSAASVKFVTANNTEYTAATVSFINSGEIIATTPRNFSVGDEPLGIKVINSSGLSYSVSGLIDCGGIPAWTTSAGSLGSIIDKYGTYSNVAYLNAVDPEGNTVTYSISIGSLPAGMNLAANGVISGDPTDLSGATSTATSTFTALASDGVNNSSAREFSLTVTAAKDGTSNVRAANTGTAIKTLNSSAANGTYWIDPYTNASYSNPQQYTVDMVGNGWITVPLGTVYSTINSNKSYIAGIQGSNLFSNNGSVSWDGTNLVFSQVGGSNNGYNWAGALFDRAILGRAAEYNGWKDIDITFQESYDWGFFGLNLHTVGDWSFAEGAANGNNSVLNGYGPGAASFSVINNNSNNINQANFSWYNGTTYASSTLRNTGGNGGSTVYRVTIIAGVAKYYISGSLVGTYDLTNTSTYTGSPITANTKWMIIMSAQSPSSFTISSLKVR